MEPLNQSINSRQFKYAQQDPQYRGQPLHNDYANGPRQQRKCTDLLCCLLFLAFQAGVIIIAIFAFTKGHPNLISAPFDSSGQQCGISPGYSQTPYVYYNLYNVSNFCCINMCPKNSNQVAQLQCMYNKSNINCSTYGSYETNKIVDICFPYQTNISNLINPQIQFMQKSISDLKKTWYMQLVILFIALILSIIVMLLIRACGGCLIWSLIVIYFLTLTIFGFVCFFQSPHYTSTTINPFKNSTDLKNIAYVCWSIDVASFLIFLCVYKKIKVGIYVIKLTADFTREECQTILVPFIMFISIGIFIAFWIITTIYLYSSGIPANSCSTPYGCVTWNNNIRNSIIYYFIALFWNLEFLIAMTQFIIASTMAYWYFSNLNQNKVNSPVSKSFFRAIVYHSGSLAFGALVLCILWIIQIILEVFHWMVKQKSMSTNPVQNCCLKCFSCFLGCCVSCFQRFVRFISKNSFIMMAISGQGFCKSAHQAFYLILRSKGEYIVTNGIAHLIMFFGKLLICALSTFFGYLMITKIPQIETIIFSPFMPTLIFFVISFVVSTLFMDVFGIGAQTILLCYCLQMDIIKTLKSCPPALKQFINSL